MDLPKEIDDYIKETVDYTLGLPVSTQTLELKLHAYEEAQNSLRDQCLRLNSLMKEKDDLIERARAESSMNAQALKKFVEENQKLAAECTHLLAQCSKLESECSSYDHDRETLMDLVDETDQRAKEAESRVRELEEEKQELLGELHFYKQERDDGVYESTSMEENMLESVISTLVPKESGESAHLFLEANSGHESCRELLNMWNHLRPKTQKVLSLIAELKSLEKDKEHLTINLHRAEEEVKLLFEDNKILDEENKRLRRLYNRERNLNSSGGKSSSSNAKSNKRKSCSKSVSPAEKKIDLSDAESPRQPLSSLSNISPNSKMQ